MITIAMIMIAMMIAKSTINIIILHDDDNNNNNNNNSIASEWVSDLG